MRFEILISCSRPEFRPYHVADMLRYLVYRIEGNNREGQIIDKDGIQVGHWRMDCEQEMGKNEVYGR